MLSLVVLRPVRLLFITLAASIAAGVGCGADFGSGAPPVGDPALKDGGGRSTIHLDSSTADANYPGEKGVDPRCGSISNCDRGENPDDPLACSDHVEEAPPPPPRDAGRHEDEFDAGTSPDGGASDGGVAPVSEASTGVPPEAGSKGAEGGAEAGYAPPPSVPENPSGTHGEPFACQVSADSNGNASHKCVRSGTGDDGAPCSSTNDCRAGFACVGEAGAGECRPYCCSLVGDPCGNGQDGSSGTTFCGERLLLEPGRPPSLRVPVCIPAEECKLDETYPCVDRSTGCKCQPDQACTVVAGTTGCVKAGEGRVGNACPCAKGYFCSSQNQCVRICTTGPDDGDTALAPPRASCAPGKCQATVGFPDGFGVCIGIAPTAQ
jgi:hypothetical protein